MLLIFQSGSQYNGGEKIAQSYQNQQNIFQLAFQLDGHCPNSAMGKGQSSVAKDAGLGFIPQHRLLKSAEPIWFCNAGNAGLDGPIVWFRIRQLHRL